MQESNKEQVKIGNRRIEVSNLDKVLYPGGKFTKAKVIDYYIRISEYLPHLKNRPVTLKRFPDGVFGEFFYEKDAPSFTPEWVKTFPVPRRNSKEPDIRYILINDLPTLVWLVNLANLEIHPFLHRAVVHEEAARPHVDDARQDPVEEFQQRFLVEDDRIVPAQDGDYPDRLPRRQGPGREVDARRAARGPRRRQP